MSSDPGQTDLPAMPEPSPSGVASVTATAPAGNETPASVRRWYQQDGVLAWLLFLAVIFTYQPSWQAGFIWDDDAYVTENPLLSAPDGLSRIWFSRDSPSQYFPLTYTIFRFEHALWGLNAAGYHWGNILLHAVNGLLLWRLLRNLGVPGAWLGAALFALHPVQVESVAWITERKNVMSLFFSLLTVLAWVKFVDGPLPRRWRFYALALACHALALFSKTTACTLPAALVLILWLRKKPLNLARWCQIAPFVLFGLAMGLVTVWWERFHQGTQGELFHFSLLKRILLASHALWFYVGKLVWPANLLFSYPRWTIDPSAAVAYGWLAAALAAAVGLWLLRDRLGRGVIAAAAFYVATLSPLLGFVMLATFLYSYVADHYQYVACIGPLALAGAGLAWVARRLPERSQWLGPGLAGTLLLCLAGLSWQQSGIYQDSERLWRATMRGNPESLLAAYQLGNALVRKGSLDEGIRYYLAVLSRSPEDADLRYNLANALLRQGRLDEAIGQYEAVLRQRPRDAEAHLNLGNALVQAQRLNDGVSHIQTALTLRPGFPAACQTLGYVAWVLATSPAPGIRDPERAIALAQQADRLSGEVNPTIIRSLATAYAEAGRFNEAAAAAQRGVALALNQNNPALADVLKKMAEACQARAGAATGRPAQ